MITSQWRRLAASATAVLDRHRRTLRFRQVGGGHGACALDWCGPWCGCAPKRRDSQALCSGSSRFNVLVRKAMRRTYPAVSMRRLPTGHRLVVRSGHSAIVDAVHARPADRQAIERVAADCLRAVHRAVAGRAGGGVGRTCEAAPPRSVGRRRDGDSDAACSGPRSDRLASHRCSRSRRMRCYSDVKALVGDRVLPGPFLAIESGRVTNDSHYTRPVPD